MREGLCYSCSYDTYFQLYGQTQDFPQSHHVIQYFDTYQKDMDVIECMMCACKVKYQKNENEIWEEITC